MLSVNAIEIQKIIDESEKGRNTSFLKASHSLWLRFKNYDKNPPKVLYKSHKAVAVIFATSSDRTLYVNLYEIVTIQGYERRGYASELWSEFVADSHKKGMKRLKLSCTPQSIGFHTKNGLVYWGVDKQGSLKSDQPLMPNISEQITLRHNGIKNYKLLIPSEKVAESLKKHDIEYMDLSYKKSIETMTAIKFVGKYWLRNKLFA